MINETNNIEILRRLTNDLNRKDEELEKTIEQLRLVIAQQDVLLNNIPISVFYKDKHSVYIMANEAFSKRVGVPLNEIQGKTDYNFQEFQDIADGYFFEDVSVMESKQPIYNRQAYYTTQDGEVRWEETSKIPYFDTEGKCIGLVGITMDITEKKLKELEGVELKNRRMTDKKEIGIKDL
jgi:PAS domain S-box-containing protein